MDVRISKSYSVGQHSHDEVLELTGVAAEEISEDRLRWLSAAAFPAEAMAGKMAGTSLGWLKEALQSACVIPVDEGGSTDSLEEKMRRFREKVAEYSGIRYDIGDAVGP